jgi:hypothetical protein
VILPPWCREAVTRRVGYGTFGEDQNLTLLGISKRGVSGREREIKNPSPPLTQHEFETQAHGINPVCV